MSSLKTVAASFYLLKQIGQLFSTFFTMLSLVLSSRSRILSESKMTVDVLGTCIEANLKKVYDHEYCEEKGYKR